MNSMITVRDIDPADKRWLKSEARRLGVSMEELARRAIREKRERSSSAEPPADVIQRLFGADHDFKLPPRTNFRLKPSASGE